MKLLTLKILILKQIFEIIMLKISSKEYYNKVLGSWLGRVVGDFVGAPVEFQPYSLIKEKYGDITYYPEPIDLNQVNDE